MKKSTIITIVLIALAAFLFGFNYKNSYQPKTCYQVYLDNEVLGMIKSKTELEKYIDEKGEHYKKQLGVKKIYIPNGLEIKKIVTYNPQIVSIESIYNEIQSRKPFTVKGYQIRIKYTKNKDKKKDDLILYTLDKNLFNESLAEMVKTYVGSTRYNNYMNEKQKEITKTGTLIESIKVEETRTIKEIQIPLDEKIYKDKSELSNFLLFGNNDSKKKYKVKMGDTLDTIAYSNKISVEELFISNPNIKNRNSLLYLGQELLIGIPDPQVRVIVVEYVVREETSKYRTEYQYDSNRVIGDDYISQKGENGLERITQRIKTINGTVNYVDVVSRQELKPTINKIIIKGEKYKSNIAIIGNWAWPTVSGYYLTSDYGYRQDPFTGVRQVHGGIDLAAGYGSPIYAANNGTIMEAEYHWINGNYITINHNNGYYTIYAHMSKLKATTIGSTVSRGEVIGYMGMTGYATGPHLHFEVWAGGKPWYGGTRISPWNLYR